MCATTTASSVSAVPASNPGRSTFTTALLTIVGAFQEALAMRRAAQKRVFLGDE